MGDTGPEDGRDSGPVVLAAAYRALGRATVIVNQAIEAVTLGILAILVSLNGIEIVSRSFFDYSLFWAFEIYELLANWMYFLGVVLVYHRGQDITLDWLYEKLGRRARRRAMLTINLVGVGVLVVLAWYGVKIVELQSENKTTGLGIPNHLFSLPVLIGAMAMLLAVARQWLATFLGIKERAEMAA